MDEKKLEELGCLQAIITAEFPQMECHLDSDHGMFLKATSKSSVSSGLRYLPNFHVIFTHLDSGSFCSRLITYHGRSLDCFAFKCGVTESNITLPENVNSLLKNVSEGIKLCLGIHLSHQDPILSNFPNQIDCLIECFDNAIVARHKKCTFLLPYSTIAAECNKCQTLVPIKRENEDYKSEFVDQEEGVDPLTYVGIEHNTEDDFDLRTKEEQASDTENVEDSKRNRRKSKQISRLELADEVMLNEWNQVKKLKPSKLRLKKPKKEKNAVHFNSNGGVFEKATDVFNEIPKKRGRPVGSKTNPNSPKKKKKINRDRNYAIPLESMYTNISGTTDLQCRICLERISQKILSRPYRHFKSHKFQYESDGTLDCPECNETIPKLELTEHFDLKHSTKELPKTCCMICLEILPITDADTLKLHVIKNHKKRHVCDMCGKSYKQERILECHVKTEHSDVKEHFCDTCGKGFGHELALQHHIKSTEPCGKEIWKCAICSKTFHTRNRLHAHLMIHCEEKPYSCKQCGYR